MVNRNATYEIKEGKLYVNGDPVPLRKGVVYAALARAGWDGYEGELDHDLVEQMLRLDRRVSLIALGLAKPPAA
ncbi:MAG TPA: hypothetical protein VE981_22885 [Planctomycetota bacterium]|nr:hypothetical protein [Planctomycetota bacterium]